MFHTRFGHVALVLLSIGIVGFGQPAWNTTLSVLSSLVGYALFFYVLLDYSSKKARFFLGTLWFGTVQLIQLSWLLAHPFLYIYFLWPAVSYVIGTQFGVLSLLITREKVARVGSLLVIASVWTLIEWSRLFFLSGYTWNPIGLALSATLPSLQMASLAGVYGLSFWVIFVNLSALRAVICRRTALFCIAALFPFVFGFIQLSIHLPRMQAHEAAHEDPFHVVLVQTAFPVEEALGFWETKNMMLFVLDEWRQILNITAAHQGKDIDLVALPEFVVPFGTWATVYPYEKVREVFLQTHGIKALAVLPPLAPPFARWGHAGTGKPGWYVCNAYFLQALSNIYGSQVMAGLEDVENDENGERIYYSAALHFEPSEPTPDMIAENYLHYPVSRYEKRVLVPMGEYIPFSFMNDLAKYYGIPGSFTSGKEAKLFDSGKVPFGVSICYEETFGDLMRESRLLGAELIVNMTSDAWFPNSRLPQQHFDHSRLRTVETGVPLVRACNTGVTSGVDSLGRVVAELGDTPEEKEWLAEALYFRVPTYTYQTIYSQFGDGTVIGFSLLMVVLAARKRLY